MTDKPYSETIDEATPRPWTLNGFNLSQVIRIEEGPDEKGRSYIDGRHQVEVISFRSMADARLAVQAVNAHDGLVAENKRLRAELAEAIRAHDSASFDAGEKAMRERAAEYIATCTNPFISESYAIGFARAVDIFAHAIRTLPTGEK